MSAWTKGLADAPQDRQIMIRRPAWDCPCFMRYETIEGVGYWCWVEQVLSDIAGALEPDEMIDAEWAEVPQ